MALHSFLSASVKLKTLDESRLLVAIVQSTRDLLTKWYLLSRQSSLSVLLFLTYNRRSSRLSVDRLHKSHFVLLYLDCLKSMKLVVLQNQQSHLSLLPPSRIRVMPLDILSKVSVKSLLLLTFSSG